MNVIYCKRPGGIRASGGELVGDWPGGERRAGPQWGKDKNRIGLWRSALYSRSSFSFWSCRKAEGKKYPPAGGKGCGCHCRSGGGNSIHASNLYETVTSYYLETLVISYVFPQLKASSLRGLQVFGTFLVHQQCPLLPRTVEANYGLIFQCKIGKSNSIIRTLINSQNEELLAQNGRTQLRNILCAYSFSLTFSIIAVYVRKFSRNLEDIFRGGKAKNFKNRFSKWHFRYARFSSNKGTLFPYVILTKIYWDESP